MFLRIMAVLLGLVGISGIGIAFMLAQKPAPEPRSPLRRHPCRLRPRPNRTSCRRPRLARRKPAGDGGYRRNRRADRTGAAGQLCRYNRCPLGVAGAMVRRSLAPNEPILAGDVLNPGDRGFLAAVLGTGMRAVTVGVDPVSGTAGLIWPGDHVDVVLTQCD